MQVKELTTKRPVKVRRPSAKIGQPVAEATGEKPIQDRVSLETVKKTESGNSLARLKENGLDTALAGALNANLPPTVGVPAGTAFKSGFVKGYISPEEVVERCQALQKEFPHLVEIIDTGIKSHGYDGSDVSKRGASNLFFLRLGPQTEDRDQKVGVFQFKAPHARERMNAMSMMEFTEQLVRNYDPASQDPEVKANTKMLDDLDVFVAINTNPDGTQFVIHDDKWWRKNRAPIPGSNSVGVDINRNFPFQWEPSRPGGQTYSGSGPASEPETQAILKVVKDHPNIKFVVDWHSHGQEIRRPMGVKTREDDAIYDEMHGRVKDAIKGATGNHYRPVVSQVTKGSSDDHFYHTDGIYSTVMETGREFIPPDSEALTVMKESVAGAHEFLAFAADYQQRNSAQA